MGSLSASHPAEGGVDRPVQGVPPHAGPVRPGDAAVPAAAPVRRREVRADVRDAVLPDARRDLDELGHRARDGARPQPPVRGRGARGPAHRQDPRHVEEAGQGHAGGHRV